MLEAMMAAMKAALRDVPASQVCNQSQGRLYFKAQSQVTKRSLRLPLNLLSTCRWCNLVTWWCFLALELGLEGWQHGVQALC